MSSNRADSDGGWRLNEKQAERLVDAVAGLKQQAEGRDLGPAGDAEIQLDLFAYFPKILVPGARTARKTRYPFETPLFVIGGWNKLEDATDVEIPLESKRRALKAIGKEAVKWMKDFNTVGRPLMQWMVDWVEQHILELIPELQFALKHPHAMPDGAFSAPAGAAAPLSRPRATGRCLPG